MFKYLLIFLIVLSASCQKQQEIKSVVKLPKTLNEVSGNEIIQGDTVVWMHNDSGDKARLFCLNEEGQLLKKINVDAKNDDWEDITSDEKGNLYIGNFGNNENKRKDLEILILKKPALTSDKKATVKRIEFRYEDQKKFPPKKKAMYFDCEAFFYFNNHLYLFTKSRVENAYGITNVYKIPAKKGNHKAKLIGSFFFNESFNDQYSWVTGADIRDDGKQIAILTQRNIWLYSNFKDDDFFNGEETKIPIKQLTQKEGICYKNSNTLLVTDEYSRGVGGTLHVYKIPSKP